MLRLAIGDGEWGGHGNMVFLLDSWVVRVEGGVLSNEDGGPMPGFGLVIHSSLILAGFVVVGGFWPWVAVFEVIDV